MEGRRTEADSFEERPQKRRPPAADAYFTVEAALVVPVVIGILVMLLYLSFYLYDRCVLAQDCYILSYRQSIEKGNADRAGAGAALDRFGEKLFMLTELHTDSSGGGTIRVKAAARMTPPIPGLLTGIGRTWGLTVEEKAKKTDPPKDYRRVRRLLHLAAAAGGAGTP